MENNQELCKDSERRKLQEDIERLQNVIGDDDFNSDEDSDDDILHIDINSNAEGEDDFRQTPGGFSSQAASVIHDSVIVDDDREGDEIVINLNENVPIDPDTCLALNKAYQEVLLDTLRSIEMALIENRDKQDRIQENLDENPKRAKVTDSTGRRTITSYQRPFFSDVHGDVPPPNTDVFIKRRTEEQRQDIRPQQAWRKNMKTAMKEAVYLDSLSQQTRDLLNRKEIYYEKLSNMSKEAHGEEFEKFVEKINDIDTEVTRITNLPKEEVIKKADTDRVDWMKISNTVLKNLRDPTECELYWKNSLNPAINKKDFGKPEKDKLKKLVDKYDNKNWVAISKELGTNRTPFQCFQYYQQHLNELFTKRDWTETEDQILVDVVDSCRVGKIISWTQVSYFIEGRSSNQCALRWAQINPEIKRGKWSDEEDTKLLCAVYLYGEKEWEKVAEYVPGRTIPQCRERYKSSLDPKLRPPDFWTYEEDKQLLNIGEQLRKPDGKIPWSKLAERLPGRTDNMVLSRYKKLQEWKEKCGWLETQDEKTKTDLGYIDLEALSKGKGERFGKKYRTKSNDKSVLGISKQNQEDYRRLSKALSKLPVVEYRYDYIKQLKDTREGNLVVPRPPLMYRYTRRLTKNIWTRKKHMKNLVEKHLSSINVTKPEDRVLLPEKTAQEFKPFTSLSERQMKKVQRILEKKNPCEISVKELLETTNKEAPVPNETVTVRRDRKNRLDAEIEKKIMDILQFKHCYITKWRKPCGRPKKFYFFHPNGKKPSKFEPENTVQLSTVTSTLLFSALEIDGKKAMETYPTLIAKKRKLLKPVYELLGRCFPKALPAPSQVVQSGPHGSGTKRKSFTEDDETYRPKRKTRLTPATPIEEGEQKLPDESMSRIVNNIIETTRRDVLRQDKGKRGSSPTSSDETQSAFKPHRKRKSTNSYVISNQQPKIITVNVNPTSIKTTSQMKMPKIVQLNTQKSTKGPVPTALITNANTIQNKPGQQIVKLGQSHLLGANTLKPGQKVPTSSPRVIVLKQAPRAQGQNRFPILPPSVTTIRGYEELMCQTNLLKARAGDKYNPYFYFEKSQVLENRVNPVMNERNIDSRLNFVDKVDRALETGARKVNAVLAGRSHRPDKAGSWMHPRKDLLKDLRQSEEYIKLKRRFDALFMWPAFLSLLKPDEENFFDKQEQEEKKLVSFDEFIELEEEEKKRKLMAEEAKEEEEEEDIKPAMEVETKPKSKYASMRGKLFVYYRQKARERKKEISEKRKMAKQMQMKSIAEKGLEKIRAERMAKENAFKQKQVKKWSSLVGQKQSARLIEKHDDSDYEEDRKIYIPELPMKNKKKHKLRSLKALTTVMELKKKGSSITQAFAEMRKKKALRIQLKKLKTAKTETVETSSPMKSLVSPPGYEMVPMMMSPTAPGYMMVPMMMSPGGTTTVQLQQPVTTSNSSPNKVLQPMYLMPPSPSSTPTTGALPYPVFFMPNLSGISSFQTIGQENSGVPTVSLPPHTAGQAIPTLSWPPHTTGQDVPTVSLPPHTAGQHIPIVASPDQTAGQHIPTVALPPQTAGKDIPTVSLPPMSLQTMEVDIPTVPLPPVTSDLEQTTQVNAPPEQSIDTYNSIFQSGNLSPKIISVVGADNTIASPFKSTASENSETSHVFLGTVPGQGNSPMLISVPKNSDMTVKQLIQMMGNKSRQVTETVMDTVEIVQDETDNR
ncbi:snRNA-activating protein complex subunit 4 [Mytilus galloprovincialis]|uniref:snRNA-activating protein complex subunit 4 n=1 Tax=Mytilus galloprovincialis TaxID=29158 RepID=A0A8B6EQP1_MYTGA|nr:snRNA-activating protein complex subunit 4 [Mytilus galloprovincialis]